MPPLSPNTLLRPASHLTRLSTLLSISPAPLYHTPHTLRNFTSTPTRPADYTHIVIGGGAVGLAVARRLQHSSSPSVSSSSPTSPATTPTSTLLLERHTHPGTETSSRNSEVIHAGLYYGHDSLKTHLCLQGKRQIYDLCERTGIPYRNCGKWIVAQTEDQLGELEKVHTFATSIGVPTRWISPSEAKEREPDVRCESGALESLSTGILDSHAFMQVLLGQFEEAGGVAVFGSSVSGIEPLGPGKDGSGGWRVTVNGGTPEEGVVTAETLVNSAGLAAVGVHNMIVPAGRRRKAYYAKGSYYGYSAAHPKPNTLVYPAPMRGHGGLGTHLTLDMGGQVRFGPDVEWVEDPDDYSVNDSGFMQALDDIQTYLPGLQRHCVHLDYCGIRPKLARRSAQMQGRDFVDFHVEREKGYEGWVNLMGIESPGLTSTLAIGDKVWELLYK